MSELKLYEVSEEYISYISTVEKNVFSSKENDRNNIRKYLGIVYSINGYSYYIPLSSPKNSDYRLENGVQKIRRSIIPIIRITSQSSSGELELKGTLKLNNMIPVPSSELTLYDVEHEQNLFLSAHMLYYQEITSMEGGRIFWKKSAYCCPETVCSLICISAEAEDHPAFPDTALVRMYG